MDEPVFPFLTPDAAVRQSQAFGHAEDFRSVGQGRCRVCGTTGAMSDEDRQALASLLCHPELRVGRLVYTCPPCRGLVVV